VDSNVALKTTFFCGIPQKLKHISAYYAEKNISSS